MHRWPYLISTLFSVGLLGAVSSFASRPVLAVQVADGTVYFTSPPQLGAVSSTDPAVNAGATYYFTLTVPPNAGEPLGQVTIAQAEGGDTVRFNPAAIAAFAGLGRSGAPVSLGPVTVDRPTKTVSVNFAPPIAPGKTVTIALTPDRNPQLSGVYLFGVTAFPVGAKTHGQFLGFGRLHFYSSHD